MIENCWEILRVKISLFKKIKQNLVDGHSLCVCVKTPCFANTLKTGPWVFCFHLFYFVIVRKEQIIMYNITQPQFFFKYKSCHGDGEGTLSLFHHKLILGHLFLLLKYPEIGRINPVSSNKNIFVISASSSARWGYVHIRHEVKAWYFVTSFWLVKYIILALLCEWAF